MTLVQDNFTIRIAEGSRNGLKRLTFVRGTLRKTRKVSEIRQLWLVAPNSSRISHECVRGKVTLVGSDINNDPVRKMQFVINFGQQYLQYHSEIDDRVSAVYEDLPDR